MPVRSTASPSPIRPSICPSWSASSDRGSPNPVIPMFRFLAAPTSSERRYPPRQDCWSSARRAMAEPTIRSRVRARPICFRCRTAPIPRRAPSAGAMAAIWICRWASWQLATVSAIRSRSTRTGLSSARRATWARTTAISGSARSICSRSPAAILPVFRSKGPLVAVMAASRTLQCHSCPPTTASAARSR